MRLAQRMEVGCISCTSPGGSIGFIMDPSTCGLHEHRPKNHGRHAHPWLVVAGKTWWWRRRRRKRRRRRTTTRRRSSMGDEVLGPVAVQVGDGHGVGAGASRG